MKVKPIAIKNFRLYNLKVSTFGPIGPTILYICV